MPGLDVSANFDPKLISSLNSFASSRELYASAVLAQIAEETGGDFFHHNNDLNAGFERLGEEPLSYILAFAPSNLDGKFHKLQVKLTQSKGNVQARRRGYFAVKNEAVAEAKLMGVSDTEALTKEQIREAILSRADMQQFQVALGAKLSEGQGEKRQLSLFAHLDAKPLHFHKDGEHNLNTPRSR